MFEIKGKSPSFQGIVTEVIDENNFKMKHHGSFFYGTNNPEDQLQINRFLSEHIFPIIIHETSQKRIREKLKISYIRVEMYSDRRKNKITIGSTNTPSSDRIYVETEKPHNKKPGDLVDPEKHNGGIKSIDVQNQDPNAAIMVFAKWKQWYGLFDLVYNRGHAIEKHKRAKEFVDTAREAFNKKNYYAFYSNAWDAYELYMEIMTMMMGSISPGENHQEIFAKFKAMYESKAGIFITGYEKLTAIRENARYGPPHTSIEQIGKEASAFNDLLNDLDIYVDDYLNKRFIQFRGKKYTIIENVPSDSKLNTL